MLDEIPDEILQNNLHPMFARKTGRVDLTRSMRARGVLARLMPVLIERGERVSDSRRLVQFPSDVLLWLLERVADQVDAD